MEKFTTCPQSARNYLILGREPHAKNAALTFGGAIHAGLEVFMKGYGGGFDEQMLHHQESTENFHRRQDQAITNFFAAHPAPPDEYRTQATALEVMKHYRRRSELPDYQWEVMSDKDGPLVERAFELPLGVVEVDSTFSMPWLTQEQYDSELIEINAEGEVYVKVIEIAWSGRIDAIVRANGFVRVVDHKTTSFADEKFSKEFELRNQILGYVWAARQLYPELDVSGFVLNAIHLKKAGINQKLDQPGPRGGEPPLNFFRNYYQYSPARIVQWEDNARAIVSDFIHCLVRNFYPKHTAWCFGITDHMAGKYGQCPYHEACCIDDPKKRENYLKSDYFKAVTWNPVHR